MGNFSRFAEDGSNLVYVVAFDPGETTGWCVMGASKSALEPSGADLRYAIRHVEYGQIKCNEQPGNGWEDTVNKHAGLMLWGENRGVTTMLDIVNLFPKAAIIFEDFIPDPKKFDQARHTLSPVRITSAFCYGLEQQGFSLSQLHVMNRSLVKTTCTDLRMKNWGMYDSGSGPHARDASRYARYFLRECSGNGIKNAENRYNAWPHSFSNPRNGLPSASAQMAKRPAPKVGERIRAR